jgi:hypothetical protein
MTSPGTPTAYSSTTLGGLIQSIRGQIPDPVSDPALDGDYFSFADLVRWINRGMETMCSKAPFIEDWYAVQSVNGTDLYVLPDRIVGVRQLWYDLWPCYPGAEFDNVFPRKISSRSFFFGPHSRHATPVLSVWPTANRTGATTTLTTTVTASSSTIVLGDTATYLDYGFFKIEDELIAYRTVDKTTTTITNVLRGQGGTLATAHTSGAAVTETNIHFKCSRLARAVSLVSDEIELPLGAVHILEKYVLSRCRQAEQEFQEARALEGEFERECQALADSAQRGLVQGTRVRTLPVGPTLLFGRVIVP